MLHAKGVSIEPWNEAGTSQLASRISTNPGQGRAGQGNPGQENQTKAVAKAAAKVAKAVVLGGKSS